MDALARTLGADRIAVHAPAERRMLERWRRPRRGPSLGTLDAFVACLRRERRSLGDDGAEWERIDWTRGALVVAEATCEPWYLAGGPAPYHDTFTTSVRIAARDEESVSRALADAARAARVAVDVVDLRAAPRR